MTATLWWDRQRKVYMSRCEDSFTLSPAYVVVSVVKRMIEGGLAIPLLPGYDTRILGQIAWYLGGYGAEVRVEPRQGDEIAWLARNVIEHWADELEHPGELEAFEEAVRVLGDRPVTKS